MRPAARPGTLGGVSATLLVVLGVVGFALATSRNSTVRESRFRHEVLVGARQFAAAMRTAELGVLEAASLSTAGFRSVAPQVRASAQLDAIALLDRSGTVQQVFEGAAERHLAIGESAASIDERLVATLARAADRGGVVASGPVELPGHPVVEMLVAARYEPLLETAATSERRARAAGWVVAVLDPQAVQATAYADLHDGVTRTVDDGVVISGAGGDEPARDQPLDLVLDLGVGDRTWRVEAVLAPGGQAALPWLVLTAALVLAAVIAIASWFAARARRDVDRRASARTRELELLAVLAPMLQQSLEVDSLLPTVAIQMIEEFDLSAVSVAVAGEGGRLVERFIAGTGLDGGPATIAECSMYGGGTVAAGVVTTLPLRQSGRVIGVIRLRPESRLGSSRAGSLVVVADLLGAALGNARLYQREQDAVRSLSELDRLKTEFLGTISHELRTPVTAIYGFGSLLLETWDDVGDNERRDLLQRITRNAESLASLMQDLLDFARLERAALHVEPVEVDLSHLVRDGVSQLDHVVGRHHLETQVQPGLQAIADPEGVDRIVANFLTNAAKFSPIGSTIRVSLVAEGDRVRLAVDDQGPGVPPDERGRIFTRFYRGETGAARSTRGAGVGLAVVKEYVDRMGAVVGVTDSALGGAQFTVHFATSNGSLMPAGQEREGGLDASSS